MQPFLRLCSPLLLALAFVALPVSTSAAEKPPKDKEKPVKCTSCPDPSKCPAGCCESCTKPTK